MSRREDSALPRLGWRLALAAGALYALVFVVLSWPLLRHPATSVLDTVSLYGPAAILIQRDINLTMWTLAWVSHALVTQPLHLFHANVLYPAPYSLATTEHMLGNAPFFTPVYLLTGNPVLAHQVTLAASFAVAGVALAAWALYWTRDRWVALAAGFLFAFAPFRFWQLGNLHVISIGWLPLVMLGIDRTLDGHPGRQGPLLLAAGLVLSSFCSYYIGYAAFTLAGVYLLVGLVVRGRQATAALPALVVSLAASAVAVGVLTVPYVLLQRSGVLPDYAQQGRTSLAFLGMLKFGPTGMLSWYVLPRRDGIPQFLTYSMLACAGVGLVAQRRGPRAALVAAVLVGIVLSLGPRLITRGVNVSMPYRWLMLVVPGFSAMRVPQRFGALATVGVAALAALGLGTMCGALRRRGWTRAAIALPALVVVGGLLESTPRGLASLSMPVGAAVPPAYRWLAEHGEHAPLLELPASRGDLQQQSVYTYYSTVHWLPLVNGYSGYPPSSFVDVMTAAEHLPDPDALRTILGRVRIRWVLLHRDAIQTWNRAAWEETFRGQLRPVQDFGNAVLFEVPDAAG